MRILIRGKDRRSQAENPLILSSRFPRPALTCVQRGKTDAADAEAICEAVTRPTLRFVTIKTVDQQAALMLHKTRDLLQGRLTPDRASDDSPVENGSLGKGYGCGAWHDTVTGPARQPS